MELAQLLRNYAEYNLQENTGMVKWLKTQPLELIDTVVPSSFPGIRPTLLHIWDVEDSWLADLTGKAADPDLEKGFKGSFEELCSGLLGKSAEFATFVQGLSTAGLLEICQCLKNDGSSEYLRRFEIIQHCMNHSSFHRGQIIAIARILRLNNLPVCVFDNIMRTDSHTELPD